MSQQKIQKWKVLSPRMNSLFIPHLLPNEVKEKKIYKIGNLEISQKQTPYALIYIVLFQVLLKCYMMLLWARTLMETSLLLGSVKNCCPTDWVHFQSSCYFFSTNTMSWTSSLKNCSDMGAHLVVINTQEEQVVGAQPPPAST